MKLSLLLLAQAKTVKKRFSGGFLDRVRLYVRGGPGGSGIPKFGGVGGNGGNVYVVGQPDSSLKDIFNKFPSKRIVAETGEASRNYRILGGSGNDVTISVPLGITVVTDDGIVLGEINAEGDKVLVASGGMGGNPKNQYNGQRGFARSITLDLKLIADVGFVGFPNAGKSTLLKALSRASPKIASYPFTTIRPNLGVMQFDDFRQISLADLPGLIEGAHQNYGMGHNFLKHVVRTKVLLFVIDIHGFQLNPMAGFRNAFETILLLNKELELYKENVVDKPAILVLNKMDVDGAEQSLEQCLDCVKMADQLLETLPEDIRPTRVIRFDKVLPISANNGYNVDKLKDVIRTTIDLNFEDSVMTYASLQDPNAKTGLKLM